MVKVYWNSFGNNQDNDADRDLLFNSMVEPAIHSCDWLKKLPLLSQDFLGSTKGLTPKELHEASDRSGIPLEEAHTAKSCPAIIDLLTHSYVLKAPLDLTYSFNTFSQTPVRELAMGLNLTSHAGSQFQNSTDVLGNKRSLKIGLPFLISVSDPDVQVMYLPATYHKQAKHIEHTSGVISGNHTNRFEMNIQTMVDTEHDYLSIKAGEALCYLYFSKKTSFVYDNTLRPMLVKSRMLSPSASPKFVPNKWYSKLFNKG